MCRVFTHVDRNGPPRVYHYHMKKTAISMLVGFVLVLPIVASALTADEIRAQIAQLLSQLQALQQQIAQVNAQDTSGTANSANGAMCFRSYRNLQRSMRGSDVEKLQRFLLNTGDYTYGEITGFFGGATELAVQRFQCRNNIACSGTPDDNGYGFVGARTRALMSARCSTTQTTPPPTTPAAIYQCPAITQPACTSGTLSSLGNDANGCHRGWLCEVRTVIQNNAPRLELSGPGSLFLNEQGTWTVKVTDPDGDNVTVNMYFGNESAIEFINEIANPTSSKSFTRARSFSTVGSYPIRVEASDTFNNSARITSVVQVRGKSCSVNGTTIEHGASKTLYSQTAPTSGNTCGVASQSRACNNGTLSGDNSYQYTTCYEAPAVPASGSGGTSGTTGSSINSCPFVSGGSCQGVNGAHPNGTTVDGSMITTGHPYLGGAVVVATYTCTDGAWVCSPTAYNPCAPKGVRLQYAPGPTCYNGGLCMSSGSLQQCSVVSSASVGGSCVLDGASYPEGSTSAGPTCFTFGCSQRMVSSTELTCRASQWVWTGNGTSVCSTPSLLAPATYGCGSNIQSSTSGGSCIAANGTTYAEGAVVATCPAIRTGDSCAVGTAYLPPFRCTSGQWQQTSAGYPCSVGQCVKQAGPAGYSCGSCDGSIVR